MQDNQQNNFQWPFLILLALTGTFGPAMPLSCMPVLFEEISEDLGLSLVQLGTIWGISGLAGIFTSLVSGVIADRFGVKVVLGVSCLVVGITGGLRGAADSYFMLTALMFINSIARLIIPFSITKTIGERFRGPKLGTAIGMSAMGMGLGLMLGPLISATLLSPLLGGWRNVMYFFGAISTLFGVIWCIIPVENQSTATNTAFKDKAAIKESFLRLIKIKTLWLLGLTMSFRQGGILGVTGYLALYLRDRGWSIPSSDGALSLFYAISTILVVPLSLLSDKLGSRKAILFPALLLTIFCTALIPIVPDGMVWVMVVLAGAFADGYLALMVTIIIETEGVGARYSGMALGIVFTIGQAGQLLAPPIGNSFADTGAGVPFFFWAGMAAAAFLSFLFVKETGSRILRVTGKPASSIESFKKI